MSCHGSHEDCGRSDTETPDGVICGFCHPEALSEWDRLVMSEFSRWLRDIAPLIEAFGGGITYRYYVRPQWVEYEKGCGSAPPLMWEGDDS